MSEEREISRLSVLELQVACRSFECLVARESAENGKPACADAMVGLLGDEGTVGGTNPG